ncbi:hypothetical protein [Halococcus thailandensis]|uniref:Glycosyltransferase RgtA/B/C/D-like domain-containing protein n=1 Tax=Halococcus thailandensis JCM 13552 TaxID=1227457 RepID=M0NCT6_9EURY|nr:hypothetical protein [Halococcus thailandensis]EMA55378.1 hypothetical protein C451_05428 [Halococcus thailandensis JCM 13552]
MRRLRAFISLRKLLTLAAVLRLAGIPLSITGINPYATADATGFAARAQDIAMTTLAGHPQTGPLFWLDGHLIVGAVKIYNLWGLTLAPVYLLAGPSTTYARIILAALGVVAIWNVYAIGRALYSRPAGIIAAFPVAIYPSFVLIHATVLREVAVLFLLTSVARLVIVPSRFSRPVRTLCCVTGLIGAGLLRWDLFFLYIPTIVGGSVVYLIAMTTAVREWSVSRYSGAVVIAVPIAYVVWQAAKRATSHLSNLRNLRARGRTVYLADIQFPHVPEMLAFAPVAVAYFLFAPFPWMIGAFSDIVVAFEGFGNIGFALAALAGVYTILTQWTALDARHRAGWVALAVWLLAGSVLFGLGTVNVGTAVRHRQMFVWVLYLFGAVGIVEWFLPRLSSKTTSKLLTAD